MASAEPPLTGGTENRDSEDGIKMLQSLLCFTTEEMWVAPVSSFVGLSKNPRDSGLGKWSA
jgi:hypothetical protein